MLNFLTSAGSELTQGLAQAFSRALFVEIGGVPLILVWLIAGAVTATLRLRLINLRALGHAIAIVRGRYDLPQAKRGQLSQQSSQQISSAQALATAISATVGLGNIAGVAIALRLGGPGAAFWMTLAGVLGMSLKFTECTLGQRYRQIRSDGRPVGGPMYYLSAGLAELGRPRLGRWLAAASALLCAVATLASAGLFQVSQSYGAIETALGAGALPLPLPSWLYGLAMAGVVGWVTLGGASRVGEVAGRLVPVMCGLYGAICLWVIGSHFAEVPAALNVIVTGAFHPQAAVGGAVGVAVQGLRRAAFSNEAGIGSSAIAHAASRSREPVREGLVAMLEPLIDTGIVCNLTAIAILVTGALDNADFADLSGAALTSAAFGSVVSWFPQVLAVVVLCFAVSTIISWGHYGEQAWVYLFGSGRLRLYRLALLASILVGAIAAPGLVVDLSDALFLAMAIPNLSGVHLLLGRVSQDLQIYWTKLRAGEFEPVSDAVNLVEPGAIGRPVIASAPAAPVPSGSAVPKSNSSVPVP